MRTGFPPFDAGFPAIGAWWNPIPFDGESGRSCSPSSTYVISRLDSLLWQSALPEARRGSAQEGHRGVPRGPFRFQLTYINDRHRAADSCKFKQSP